MSNMEQGVQAFLAELKRLGAENVGLYIGAYFMLEQEVSTKNFDAVWIPAYGTDSGYYEALPNTEIDYDLHQYTSQGSLPGFDNILDLNQINPEKNKFNSTVMNSNYYDQIRMFANDMERQNAILLSFGFSFAFSTFCRIQKYSSFQTTYV